MGLRVLLEARQETDTGMDKTPKGWWKDGWMDGWVSKVRKDLSEARRGRKQEKMGGKSREKKRKCRKNRYSTSKSWTNIYQ